MRSRLSTKTIINVLVIIAGVGIFVFLYINFHAIRENTISIDSQLRTLNKVMDQQENETLLSGYSSMRNIDTKLLLYGQDRRRRRLLKKLNFW